MVYSVKEIFMTLQGEGCHAGRPAVFLRFSGCNLWNGLEKDRSFAVCQFCDTDFVGTDGTNGGKYKTAQELAQAVLAQWTGDVGTGDVGTGDVGTGDVGTGDVGTGDVGTGDVGTGDVGTGGTNYRYVVITGGEPLLQLDSALITALHNIGFKIAIETNGTIKPPPDVLDNIDWICMSPKANSDIQLFSGHELKFVYPQDNFSPHIFENFKFQHFYLQPKDDANQQLNIQKSVEFCQKNPKWHLSLQTHKLINIP